MSNLARQDLFFGRFLDIEEIVERIEGVTAEDVRSIAQTFLKPEDLALTVVGPVGGQKFTRRDLVC
jgi:predicted Zn-dependent peptidase